MSLELLEHGLKQLEVTGVTDRSAADLMRFLEELLRWNRHHNLTAINDLTSGIEKHLLDSLTLLPHLVGVERLLDIGSGAGLPGLPLKIVRPGLDVVSIDGVAKKISFQRHIIRRFGLARTRAFACRIEQLAEDPEFVGAFNVIVFRALGALQRFIPLALPCLAEHGRFLVMKGPEGGAELKESEALLRQLGLSCQQTHELALPGSGARRTILEIGRHFAQI